VRSPLLPAGLRNVGWRYLWVHRWQSLLMVLGIALGVAVVVAIDLANASAGRAFELSTEAVTGRATHRIQGSQEGVDDSVYMRLRSAGLGVPLAPVISETVFAQALGGRPFQMLGIDPFAEAPFRAYLGYCFQPPWLNNTACSRAKPLRSRSTPAKWHYSSQG
jgi:putative ABC transport system permease protein